MITVAVGLLLGALVSAIVVGAFSAAQDGTVRVVVDPATYAGMLGASRRSGWPRAPYRLGPVAPAWSAGAGRGR
ncbi:hypothetical protein NKG94_05305 [Micromonospora sp. M12]